MPFYSDDGCDVLYYKKNKTKLLGDVRRMFNNDLK